MNCGMKYKILYPGHDSLAIFELENRLYKVSSPVVDSQTKIQLSDSGNLLGIHSNTVMTLAFSSQS